MRGIGEHFRQYAHALRFAIGLHGAYKFHPIVKCKHYQFSSGARASLSRTHNLSNLFLDIFNDSAFTTSALREFQSLMILTLKVRPAPMSVYNGILRSYFLLGTNISFASNNDEKIVDHIYMFSYYP